MAEKFKRDVSTPIELAVEVDNVNTIYAWAKASTKPTYTKSEVGLGSVDNTSDATKNVLSATKLSANRTITLTGDVTGSVLTDFSGNPTISTTVVDDSHNHIISNVDGLQTALDGKLATTANAVSATKLQTARTIRLSNLATSTATSFDGTSNISIPLNSIDPKAISRGYTTNRFYVDTHPENGGVIIPFINNDIAFLTKKGGSVSVYYDGVLQSINTDNMFDATPSYWAINPTGITEIIIEMTLQRVFIWSNTAYVSFGSGTWRSSNIKVEVMNTNNGEVTWTNKSTVTSNTLGEHYIYFMHNRGTGFNKLRFIFSGWNVPTAFRIAQLGLISCGSSGLKETYVSIGGSQIYGDLYPYNDSTHSLGNSAHYWANIYADNHIGNLVGNADTSTKLATPRTIALNGDVSGSASFDGSANITISSTVSDNSHNHDNSTIAPLASKTYTGIYATANDFASGTFYFASVRPTSFTIPYHVKYRVHSSVPSYADYSGYFDVDFWGCQSARLTYACFNNHYNYSYRSLYYHTWYTLTSTGYTNGYGHALGIGLRNSVNPTSATYARTFIVEILEAQNCSATMYDTMKLYSALDGTGATNFSGYSELNGSNNGLRESGDDNNYERLMLVNDRYLAGTNGIYGQQLVMQKADGTWESLTSTYSTGTTKTKNASGFLPNKIVFYTSGTTVTSGNNIATFTVYSNISNYEFRYSSNCGTTLTPYRSVYLKGSISNGLFYLADVWYSQTLSTSDDGYVYIYLGESYTTSRINLDTEHPMYAFKGGTIQTITPYALIAPSSAILTWDGE